MRLISTEIGQVTQSWLPEEAAPSSGLYLPEVIRLVAERYSFAVQPDVASAMKEGAKFRQGRMISGNSKINIVEIGVYNDGITVVARNTTDAEFALDDIINWARQALGVLSDPPTKISKKYESALVVDLDPRVSKAFKAFVNIEQSLSENLKRLYGVDVDIGLSRLAFGSDLPPSYKLHRSDFFIERRAQRAYSDNRFFSSAPLPTQDHIGFIENFEQEMLAQAS